MQAGRVTMERDVKPTMAAGESATQRMWLAWLFLFCVGHRLVQWLVLQKQIAVAAALNGDVAIMQLLPADLWRQQFWAALLYLQQTPPVPNLIYGIAALCFDSGPSLATFLILFCGLLSSIACVLMALLLTRLGFARWLACAIAVVFLLSADLLMFDYFAFGQSFYEQLTMVGVLCAALAAIALARAGGWRAALVLGCAVALLALTRASFSYFVLPAFLWLLWNMRSRIDAKVLAGFLLPVLLLHGGWALKQSIVQGSWMWSTSSWGGLNMMMGDVRRIGVRARDGENTESIPVFDMAQAARQTPCLQRWRHLWKTSPFVLFSAAFDGTAATNAGPSAAALDRDATAAQARGGRFALDSAALREFSHCLQRARQTFWLQHPGWALRAGWQSYGVFWSPLGGVAETAPTLLMPVKPLWLNPPASPVWRPQGELLTWPAYLIRQQKYRLFLYYDAQDMAPATMLVLPFLPSMFALLAMIALHLLPPVAAVMCWRNPAGFAGAWPAGLGFLIITYLYLAGVSSLVEYGENMRFRLEVEPVIWAIGMVALRMLWQELRKRKPNGAA